MLLRPPYSVLLSSAPPLLPETRALVAAMSVVPSGGRQVLINAFINSLKISGIWSKLDVLYVLAAHDAQAARLNWKSPGSFTLAATNSPTFATDRGYTNDI